MTSWWRRLFGKAETPAPTVFLPEAAPGPVSRPKDREPPYPAPGARVLVELRDERRPDWVRERGYTVDGLREGVWEQLSITGEPMIRVTWRAGVLDGPVEWRHAPEKPWIAGQNAAGVPVDRWVHRRRDGTLAAEVDYEAGKLVRWRWVDRQGRDRPPPAAANTEDVERWIALGDAWEEALEPKGDTYGVELSVDQWPPDERAPVFAWIDAQVDRPEQWSVGSDWLDDILADASDPRAKYVTAIELDHAEWDEAQVDRVRALAPQLKELSLDECDVSPSVTALFTDVAWDKLETLHLADCGPLDEVARILEHAPWAIGLRYLSLTGSDDPPRASTLAPVLRAGWLDGLERLGLAVGGDPAPVIDALSARALPRLRYLWLYLDEDQAEGVAARLARPGLKITVKE